MVERLSAEVEQLAPLEAKVSQLEREHEALKRQLQNREAQERVYLEQVRIVTFVWC